MVIENLIDYLEYVFICYTLELIVSSCFVCVLSADKALFFLFSCIYITPYSFYNNISQNSCLFQMKKHQFDFFFFFIFWTKLSSRYNVRGKHSSQCIIVNSASITWNNTQLNSHFNSIAFIPTGFKFHFLGRPSFFSKSRILLSIQQQHF